MINENTFPEHPVAREVEVRAVELNEGSAPPRRGILRDVPAARVRSRAVPRQDRRGAAGEGAGPHLLPAGVG
eukprot:gene18825-biopygen14508